MQTRRFAWYSPWMGLTALAFAVSAPAQQITPGAVSWDASKPGDNAAKWQATDAGGPAWTIEHGATVQPVDNALPDIRTAWVFDGSAGKATMGGLKGKDKSAFLTSSFELWFKPDRLGDLNPDGNATLFETGEAGQGLAIVLQSDKTQPKLTLTAIGKFGRNPVTISCPLPADSTKRFNQAAAVVDHADRKIRFYVNGKLVRQEDHNGKGMPYWVSDGGAGLGGGNGQTGAAKAVGGGGMFPGRIAIFRHYPALALTDEQVMHNYNVIVRNESAAMTPDASPPVAAAETTPALPPRRDVFSWRSTMGTHYRLDLESWLGTVRGWPHHYSVGYHPDYTHIDHTGIAPTKGHFSGEDRYYSFTGHDRTETTTVRKAAAGQVIEDAAETTYNPDDYETRTVSKPVADVTDHIRQAMAANVDVIQLALGNVKPTRPEFKVFNDNHGLYFKDVLYQTVRHFNTGEFADKPITVYWQLGNEVNAYNRFHMKDSDQAEALNESIRKLLPNGDPANAVDYVEYYLAPAVEAIRAASKDIYGDPDRIPIVCGSVSGIRQQRNREFLDVLLNTTVRGERAPTLKGRKAWELIDVITIHYAHGSREILQPLYDQWVATGKVEGLWITEELGARGAGAYAVAQVAFRYLDFWSRRLDRWKPHSARLTVWGDTRPRHPRSFGKGREAMEIIGPFLRDYPLHQAEDETTVTSNADVESYVLRADEDAQHVRYAAYFASYTGARAKLRQFIVHGPDGRTPTRIDSLKVSVIDAALGIRELQPAASIEDGQAIVTLDYELPVTAAVIVEAVVRVEPSADN